MHKHDDDMLNNHSQHTCAAANLHTKQAMFGSDGLPSAVYPLGDKASARHSCSSSLGVRATRPMRSNGGNWQSVCQRPGYERNAAAPKACVAHKMLDPLKHPLACLSTGKDET